MCSMKKWPGSHDPVSSMGDWLLSSAGAGGNCARPIRLPDPSPVLDKNRAPMGPEILSNTGAGVGRKAPMVFPDSSSVLDKFQSAIQCFSYRRVSWILWIVGNLLQSPHKLQDFSQESFRVWVLTQLSWWGYLPQIWVSSSWKQELATIMQSLARILRTSEVYFSRQRWSALAKSPDFPCALSVVFLCPLFVDNCNNVSSSDLSFLWVAWYCLNTVQIGPLLSFRFNFFPLRSCRSSSVIFFWFLGGKIGGNFAGFFGCANKGSKHSENISEHFLWTNSYLEKIIRANFVLQTCCPSNFIVVECRFGWRKTQVPVCPLKCQFWGLKLHADKTNKNDQKL